MPPQLRIERPYADEDAFLDAEGWSLSKRVVHLIDQDPLPVDTVLRFELSLTGGERLMRAEATVLEHVPSSDGRPPGLRVKLTRMDASSKQLLTRASTLAKKSTHPGAKPAPRAAANGSSAASASQMHAETDAPAPDPELASGARTAQGTVAAPADRDALLSRLRQRLAKATPSAVKRAADG